MKRLVWPAKWTSSMHGPVTKIAAPGPALGRAALMLVKAPGVAPVQSTTNWARLAAGTHTAKARISKCLCKENLAKDLIDENRVAGNTHFDELSILSLLLDVDSNCVSREATGWVGCRFVGKQ